MQDKADSLAYLNGHVSELQEALQQASHDVARADASLRGEQAQVQLLDEAAQALRGVVATATAQMRALEAGVRNLLGDCMLAAAAVTYGGALAWHEHSRLLRRCAGALAAAGIAHTAGFSLCGFMEATKRQHALLPRNVLLDESLQASLYTVALVRPACHAFEPSYRARHSRPPARRSHNDPPEPCASRNLEFGCEFMALRFKCGVFQVPKPPFVVDEEGEGLRLLKAVHEQARKGRWVELGARAAGAAEDAAAALQSGATVAVDAEDLSKAALDGVGAICTAASRLPRAAAARLVFFARCVLCQTLWLSACSWHRRNAPRLRALADRLRST